MTVCRPTDTVPEIDLMALEEKYRAERDRRLRRDGVRQYTEAVKSGDDLVASDPFCEVKPRVPLRLETDVVVLGGGFAGLLAGANLKKAGIQDVTIIEAAGDFGGAWYWNRYPGAQCDVESYSYLPLLEDLDYVPEDRYSYQREIFSHCQNIAKHFALYDKALFHTAITDLIWDDEAARWNVSTSRQDQITARFVIMAAGPYGHPKLPGIPGTEKFAGHSFHTSRWDYEYTGDHLERLADKKVAIVGTGATAIQCVPFLAKAARHLFVFQRTPSYVDERGNRKTDQEWARSLQPGWQARHQANYHAGVFDGFNSPEDDLTCDGWTEISRNVAARVNGMGRRVEPEEMAAIWVEEDYKAMSRIRARVDRFVADPEVAELLKPWYRFMCKRPCFNDDYLPAFNRSNVSLIDVSYTKGIERLTSDSVYTGGREYKVDCIIYASGFEISQDLKARYGVGTIVGRSGVSLYDHWKDGYKTFHGLMTPIFPNMFFTGYTQVGIAAAINLMYDQQTKHIAYIIAQSRRRGASTVVPETQAAEDWVNLIRTTAQSRAEFYESCTPGYFNKEGQISKRRRLYLASRMVRDSMHSTKCYRRGARPEILKD